MHIAKQQKLFVEPNDKLAKHSENTMSEPMLTGQILSTLGKEYDRFKDVWGTIPTSQQMENLLIEELCAIELQVNKLASADAMAFIAHENDKKSKSIKVFSSKSMKGGADRAKQKFPCNKCKHLGQWAAECPHKQQHAGDRVGKSAAKKNAVAFLGHVMGASRANSVDAHSWYCDSSVTRHIMLNKQYFFSYTKYAIPETIVLGKKNVLMQAYSQGLINIQMFHNGVWHDAIVIEVWYVPDASAHLYFVKTATQNGYSTSLNENEIVIRRGYGTTAASGKLVNVLCVLTIRVCVPQHAAEVHLATQVETLQVWHDRLDYQNKGSVMKVLMQHCINVEAKREFCDGCALGKTSTELRNLDKSTRHSWRTD